MSGQSCLPATTMSKKPLKKSSGAFAISLHVSTKVRSQDETWKHRDRLLFHHIRNIIHFPIPVNLSNWRSDALIPFNSIKTAHMTEPSCPRYLETGNSPHAPQGCD